VWLPEFDTGEDTRFRILVRRRSIASRSSTKDSSSGVRRLPFVANLLFPNIPEEADPATPQDY